MKLRNGKNVALESSSTCSPQTEIQPENKTDIQTVENSYLSPNTYMLIAVVASVVMLLWIQGQMESHCAQRQPEPQPLPSTPDIDTSERRILSCLPSETGGASCVSVLVDSLDYLTKVGLDSTTRILPSSGVSFMKHQWEALQNIADIVIRNPQNRTSILRNN